MQKILHFFITKIILSIAIIAGLIVLTELFGSFLETKKLASGYTKEIIVSVLNSAIVVLAYRIIFKAYEKRNITELSASGFVKYSILGFTIGLVLQSLFILIIFLAGTYSVMHINPLSALLSPLAFALEAGFVAEILIVGIVFRIAEEKAGSVNTLILFILLFAALHINAKHATFLSVAATAMQAGFMLPAAYIYSRSLWLPIFLHFAWDLAEPGIFGAVNPSTSLSHGIITSNISGFPLLTGGLSGPQDSLQFLIICFVAGSLFLVFAKKKKNLIRMKNVKPSV